MGQPVTVVEKPSAIPGVVRYELNRSISGMDHEVYAAGVEITGDRPVDECARRILAHGGVDRVSINSSVVTVELSRGFDGSGLREVLEHLFRFYPDDPEGSIPGTVEEAEANGPGSRDAEAAVPAE